ncbi:MAG: tRNA (adenosine(37)-N6)-threonylcarbamoyltransferase complex dimerization subunit type 1 TsaB [Thermoanaerobaculia bacterium]
MDGSPALLAVDTGSPVASVAAGRRGGPATVRTVEQRRSSESLLRLIDEALAEAGLRLEELDGLLALAGPGSFTGLRVGLATLLGLHQALGVPATTLDTFDVLAFAASESRATSGRRSGAAPVLAVVDALRGDWFTRLSTPAGPTEEPELRRPEDIAALAPCVVSGFGAGDLVAASGAPAGMTAFEPAELASSTLRLALLTPPAWDAGRLSRPRYLRPPAVTPAPR